MLVFSRLFELLDLVFGLIPADPISFPGVARTPIVRQSGCTDAEMMGVHVPFSERIRAHALICFLALVMHRVRRARLEAAGSECSPTKALKTLRRIQRHKVQIAGQNYEGVTKPNTEQLALFDPIGVAIPQRPG